MRTFPLLYVPFFFDLAFFFMTLFLAVEPPAQSKAWGRADERGVNRLWRNHQQELDFAIFAAIRRAAAVNEALWLGR